MDVEERRKKLEEFRKSDFAMHLSELIGTPGYEMMRKRHAHFSQLIMDAGIKSPKEFYEKLKDHFELYGIELSINEAETVCGIWIQLDYQDYEDYTVVADDSGARCVISPVVGFQYCFANSEADIFNEEFV